MRDDLAGAFQDRPQYRPLFRYRSLTAPGSKVQSRHGSCFLPIFLPIDWWGFADSHCGLVD